MPGMASMRPAKENKNFHVKIRCEGCGRLLLHQKIMPGPGKLSQLIEVYIPPCEGCIQGMLDGIKDSPPRPDIQEGY